MQARFTSQMAFLLHARNNTYPCHCNYWTQASSLSFIVQVINNPPLCNVGKIYFSFNYKPGYSFIS